MKFFYVFVVAQYPDFFFQIWVEVIHYGNDNALKDPVQPDYTICEACVSVIQSAVHMVTHQSSEKIWYLNEPDSSGIYYNLVLLDSSWHHGRVISEAHNEVIKNFDLLIWQADI